MYVDVDVTHCQARDNVTYPQFDIDARFLLQHAHHQPAIDYRLLRTRQPRNSVLHAGKNVLHTDG
jgi:hypothetical protein